MLIQSPRQCVESTCAPDCQRPSCQAGNPHKISISSSALLLFLGASATPRCLPCLGTCSGIGSRAGGRSHYGPRYYQDVDGRTDEPAIGRRHRDRVRGSPDSDISIEEDQGKASHFTADAELSSGAALENASPRPACSRHKCYRGNGLHAGKPTANGHHSGRTCQRKRTPLVGASAGGVRREFQRCLTDRSLLAIDRLRATSQQPHCSSPTLPEEASEPFYRRAGAAGDFEPLISIVTQEIRFG